jgi:FKBP-type peptidyl-prolyl cis-trans isomerase SlyD
MQVGPDKAVSIHYTLRDDAGEVLDSSDGREPLTYLHGSGNIVPGLEKALDGKQVGDEVKVKVAPADGYGERDDANVRNVPRHPLAGMTLNFEVKVVEVRDATEEERTHGHVHGPGGHH